MIWADLHYFAKVSCDGVHLRLGLGGGGCYGDCLGFVADLQFRVHADGGICVNRQARFFLRFESGGFDS